MYLTKLVLNNFRSYPSSIFQFTPNINLIIGNNGVGKTNILEAIYFLASGKSFRSAPLSNLINWNSPQSATVEGYSLKGNENYLFEIQLIKKSSLCKTTISRNYLINRVKKSRKKYLSQFNSVIFEPDDIRLVTGSPSRRRSFLDQVFSINWHYCSALSQFNRALKHRNELLDQIRNGQSQPAELYYWNQSLAKNDVIVHNHRNLFIKFVNHFFSSHSSSEINKLFLTYYPSYLTPQIMEKNFQQEVSRGHTLAGCHRDDYTFSNRSFCTSNKELELWGSRGQQRLAVLALRLAQIDFIESEFKDKPILLLDDIFSELDTTHRRLVGQICHTYQTILTSSEDEPLKYFEQAHQIRL
ncbi:MAG: DNA replication and repair protein RecF [Candidatus Shapirobacteria bacterium]|jgi:DNA replication and repair protein RecF